ncbi:cysteine desulfurase [Marinilabiliaceae bacterium ANBcel2]|nr:cysteine desulfurase [Marinilabiliaceae bacterium ANBcel2]
MTYSIGNIRDEFPILNRKVHNSELIYFDNAATTQTPLSVVKAMDEVYSCYNSNIHRGVHHLSNISTQKFEESRRDIAKFINADKEHELIFTRGTTESINLVASSFGDAFLKEGDEVIISEMEHHSNIVPWQMLRARKGITLRVIPLLDDGTLDMDIFSSLINERTRFISVTHVSNVTGIVNPVEDIVKEARKYSIPVLIDGAQAVQHIKVDVKKLDCDFYVFSGHKLYGPTGIGLLYGKEELLDKMPPWQGGGEMIKSVSFEKTLYNELPYKFEAGTPNYVGAIGLKAAVDFIENIGVDNISLHETDLLNYGRERLQHEIQGLLFYGTGGDATSVISFLIKDLHPFDVGTLLDKMGVALRTGHHCAQPFMDRYNIPGTIRISFGVYNTHSEIDKFIGLLKRVEKLLK